MSLATAQQVLRTLGPSALEAVKLCIEECRRLDDDKAARFWSDVAAHVKSAADGEQGGPPDSFIACNDQSASRRWLLMQRIELYRHRAMRAERLAGGSEVHRQDMIEMALQWYELAQQYEALAEAI